MFRKRNKSARNKVLKMVTECAFSKTSCVDFILFINIGKSFTCAFAIREWGEC